MLTAEKVVPVVESGVIDFHTIRSYMEAERLASSDQSFIIFTDRNLDDEAAGDLVGLLVGEEQTSGDGQYPVAAVVGVWSVNGLEDAGRVAVVGPSALSTASYITEIDEDGDLSGTVPEFEAGLDEGDAFGVDHYMARKVETFGKGLTVLQLAGILGCSKQQVYKLIDQNILPAVRIGTMIRLDPASVGRWLRGSTTPERSQNS